MLIGKIIKIVSAVFAIFGMLISLLLGTFLMSTASFNGDASPAGMVVFVLGSFLSIFGFFILYGFGELIVKACQIAENTRKICDNMNFCNKSL